MSAQELLDEAERRIEREQGRHLPCKAVWLRLAIGWMRAILREQEEQKR